MLRAILVKYPKSRIIRAFSTAVAQQVAPSDDVEYPPIIDSTYIARQNRKKLETYERIKKCPTIEEKIIELNMPRYWGFKCLMMGDDWYPYNALPMVRYSTKTDFQESSLKIEDPAEAKKVDDFYNLLKTELIDTIEFELSGYKHAFEVKGEKVDPKEAHRAKAGSMVKQLNRVLTRSLGADNGHLYEADVDYDPRVEAFWFVGGNFYFFKFSWMFLKLIKTF
jgi:small subunit ribosomal protein S30